ncbi:ATP-binding protein [Mucilaginibacter flavidus]|uniref:ATP-binding protein n=1 Tax=Mucilaginibacter flavidus TaxID=2949309 RepID=UPI002092C03C|nr:ATP-binding protein [Mucilaginibacter flavidus]MCO5949877.1 ATP-binding protein [Mucilaginibacter flavidus]
MNKFLFILSLLFSSIATAAIKNDTSGVIVIDKLSGNGFYLHHGWKFQTGDDPAFAKTDYNDNNWQLLNPALRLPNLPKAAQQGIGWLRIKLSIAPGLRRNAAIIVAQSPALEVFLNGKLIAQRGVIDSRSKLGNGVFDLSPIELPLTDSNVQVLAVRFAHESDLKYFNGYLFPPIIDARFVNGPQIINNINQGNDIQTALLVGFSILVLLSILHIILFRYNTKNKGNLYFAAYALCFAIFLFSSCIGTLPQLIKIWIYNVLIGSPFYVISALLGIKALNTLFKFNSGWYYKLLIFIAVVGITDFVFSFQKFNIYFVVIVIVTGTELLLALKAIWYKRRGAILVSAGFLIGLIGTIINLYFAGDFPTIRLVPYIASIYLATLGPPLGISIFLGREFALDSRLLQIKLHQVEQLSAQTIAQEQEKQELLSFQNELLETKVRERTSELNQSLTHLQETQTQLIQAEKMASLGELTAGIAHEIQNPLNFVNNFSEVSTELIADMKQELDGGNTDEAKAIAEDVKQNLEKINYHGKRADAIVKGMLLHSQSGSGSKQLTNINALADEYFRLAYHGLRSKDKSFNAEMATDLDLDLPQINVIPLDIGRVLLNLFNNAFYSVRQKSKTVEFDYQSQVSVTTLAENEQIVIKVKDNGVGVADAIKEKIMQPFFTTKPTGEGIGLGLSLAYDMIVKGHGGNIKVNSIEGEGAEFIITIPIR